MLRHPYPLTVHAQTFLRRQPDGRRFLLRLAGRATTGALGGLSVAAVTLWLDRQAGLTLPFPTANAQVWLGTLAGGLITIAVFVLWMRMVVVGLASSQASPRVLTGYLDDGFQRTLTAWLLAGFTYVTAVMVALPSHPDGGHGIPAVSSLASLLIVVAALSSVLLATHAARSNVSMPQVVRGLADQAFTVMAAQQSPNDPPPPTAAGGTKTVLHAPRMGWIQWIDHDAIMAHLPAHTVLTLGTSIGDFVAEGQAVARADQELEAASADAIIARFTIVPTRTSEYDLAYAIQHLVDVAEHAMTPSSLDTSTAYEALMHLRAVLHRLLHNGVSTGNLRGEDERWIVTEHAWGTAGYMEVTFQRLVTGGSKDPTTAGELHDVLTSLEQTAHALGDVDSQEVLSEQRSRLEREARTGVASTGHRP